MILHPFGYFPAELYARNQKLLFWIFFRKIIELGQCVMLDKQMIPHFKGLDVALKISQEQPCSFIKDDHTTFLVKNTLFKEEVV